MRSRRITQWGIAFLLVWVNVSANSVASPTVVVIVGAPGTEEFGDQFANWADRWQKAAVEAGCEHFEFGRKATDESDRDAIKKFLMDISAPDTTSSEAVWLVFIGHGTHFRETSKWNLRGLDLSASELNEWLSPLMRPTVVINCASSSGPFINKLAAENRVVITATKSGAEHNFARFGDFLSQTISDSAADLDHDESVSLLEAFLSASNQVRQFYARENRLATEHALIDDNGDGVGTPSKFYRGVRPIQKPKADRLGNIADIDGIVTARIGLKPSGGHDHLTVEQKAELDKLERQVESLRAEKSKLSDDDAYYTQLQTLMVRVAKLYRAAANDSENR